MQNDTKVGAIVVLIALTILFVLSAFVKVGAGERGVVLNWGAVQEGVLDEGLHFKIPIYQEIKVLNVKTLIYQVEAESASSDVQTIHTIIALNYHLDPNNVGKLLQEIDADYESTIIAPAIQESVKAGTAQFVAEEVIRKRPELRDAIKIELSRKFEGRYIVIDEFSIVDLDFSDEYNKSIEEKQVAAQNALKAENDLKRVEFEAQQRVAEATAEAEAIKIQAEAITQQGGKDYVQLKAIEQWDGELPTQMIPGSTVPFINLTN